MSMEYYDVFLSFRGEARNEFTCVIREALMKVGFKTFLDKDNVRHGDQLTDKILRAIDKSESAIIIFSENYWSSKWCLIELVRILNRRRNSDTFFILPILHKLKIDDVKVRFCQEIERKYQDPVEVEGWKQALVEIGDTKAHFCGTEMVTTFADKIAERVKELFRQNSITPVNKRLEGISMSSSSHTRYSGIMRLPDTIVGLHPKLESLKEMLLNEENMTSPTVVLISGPPGCGKTTLANMVCHDSKIRAKFKKSIFFVTVSNTMDIKDIVKQVFKHKGREGELMDVHDNRQVINKLSNLLMEISEETSQDPILLVLDDVWSSKLSYVVDKFKFEGIRGYKILVTSRNNDPAFTMVCELKPLNHKESTELFRHYAFPPSSHQTNVSDHYVDQIIKGCKGFPLALEVLAKSLRGEDEVIWKFRLKEWSKRISSIVDTDNDLLEILQKSLDALDSENGMEIVKECFLDLGSFPEDQRIPATTLMDMWAELYDFDEEEDMYTYKYLLEMSYRSLLDHVSKSKEDSSDYCSGGFIKQHDMLRELAIYTSNLEHIEERKRFFIEIGKGGKPNKLVENLRKPGKARLVSISTDDSFASNWHDIDMQFPEAEVLVLNFRNINYVLPLLMKHMEKLKVLILTNYGLHHAKVSDFSLIGYLSSVKRIRLEHVSIISAFTFQLKKLKKISITLCEIGNALGNFAHLFPNLEEIEIEYCRDLVQLPAGLCRIVSLKKISIISCNELSELPQEIEGLINLELLRLSSCTKLEEIPEKIIQLQKLSLLDLTDCTKLSKMPEGIGKMKGLEKLLVRGCSGLFKLPSSVKKFSKDLTVFCDERGQSLWTSNTNATIKLVKEDISLDWLFL